MELGAPYSFGLKIICLSRNNLLSTTIAILINKITHGSILGPLLIILYSNDFSKPYYDLLFSILFSDDTSVFIEGTAYSSIIKDMNRELEMIDKWLKSNKLTINILKTHYMMFHRT